MEEEKKNIDELKSITKDTLAAVASELKPAESSEVRKLYLLYYLYIFFSINVKSNDLSSYKSFKTFVLF